MNPEEIRFQGGIRTLLGFGIAFAVIVAVWVPLTDAVSDQSPWLRLATEVGQFAAVGGFVWVLLRIDAVTLPDLGFSRRHAVPACLAFGAFWVAMNLLGLGVALLFGNGWSLTLIWHIPEQSSPVQRYGSLPGTWFIFILLQFLVVGVVEEVAFRGYLQSKIIALLGDDTRLHIAGGILVTTVVFGALHTPGAIVAGQDVSGVLGRAALPTVTAVFFGVIYELTQNLPFVALLHGFGNTWPLVINWSEWAGTDLMMFWVGTVVIYLGVILGYRYWADNTDLTPTVTRTDTGRTITQ